MSAFHTNSEPTYPSLQFCCVCNPSYNTYRKAPAAYLKLNCYDIKMRRMYFLRHHHDCCEDVVRAVVVINQLRSAAVDTRTTQITAKSHMNSQGAALLGTVT